MTEAGYRVLLSDTAVTTVHVLFDEPISERSENYSKELEEATRMNVVWVFWFGGRLRYKTKIVIVKREFIVRFHTLITAENQQI